MSRRSDDRLLHDMLDAGRAATVAIAGENQALLSADHIRVLGIVKCLEIIGEAAGQISAEFRATYPAIPWTQIIGMRNRLVHAYFEIDYEQVWSALTEDLPPLLEQVAAILTAEFSNGVQRPQSD